jgi:hypothetical protein
MKSQTHTNRSPPVTLTPTANTVNHNSNNSSVHTDGAIAGKAPPLTPSKKINKSEVTMSKRKMVSGIAYATVHYANMAILRPSDNRLNNNITSITDWLVDTGCSIHMTNCLDDFIYPPEPYESRVEVANGGVTKVGYKGTVRIHLVDLTDQLSSNSTMYSTFRHSPEDYHLDPTGEHAEELSYFILTELDYRHSTKIGN